MTSYCDFDLRFRFGSRAHDTARLCRGVLPGGLRSPDSHFDFVLCLEAGHMKRHGFAGDQVAHDLQTVTSNFVLGWEAGHMKRQS